MRLHQYGPLHIGSVQVGQAVFDTDPWSVEPLRTGSGKLWAGTKRVALSIGTHHVHLGIDQHGEKPTLRPPPSRPATLSGRQRVTLLSVGISMATRGEARDTNVDAWPVDTGAKPDRGVYAEWEVDGTISDLARIAQAADQLGYEYLTCSEHVAIPVDAPTDLGPGPRYWDPLATFGYLAAVTSRIRLTTLVLVLPYHHPLDIAKRYGTLDRICGGRLNLGVGVGYLRPEFDLLGAISTSATNEVTTRFAPFEFRSAVLSPPTKDRTLTTPV